MRQDENNCKNYSQRRERLLLLGVILLAAAMRMGWPGLTEFKADEARLMALALDMAEGRTFPLQGIASSVGFPNTAVSVWLYALPLFLWQHVYAATLFTGLVNVTGIVGCWWLARRYWGPTAAIAAALFFATNPWAIAHARKIWAQNLLPPLAVAWAITAALAFVEGRSRFVILHLLFLALLVQVHFAGLSLLPVTLLLLLLFRRRLQWRAVAIGAGVALLSGLAFVYALLDRYASVATGALPGTAWAQGELSLTSWHYLLLLSSGREIHSLAGPEQFRLYLARIPSMTPVHALWIALVVGGAVWLGWRAWRRVGEPTANDVGFLILLWLLAPPLLFTWFPVSVALHYLLPASAAAHVAGGVCFAAVLARFPRWRTPAWLILGASAALQLWAWAALLGLLAAQHTPGGFGTPLALKLQAVAALQTLQGETGAAEVLLAGNGEDPARTEFAAVYDVLLRDVPHRFVDATRAAVFPATASVVLLDAPLSGPPVDDYLQAARAVETIPLRQGEGALRVLDLPPAAAPAPDVALQTPHLFKNFVKLYGYDHPQNGAGDSLLWRIYWHPADNPLPADYHFFNHLLDAGGARLAQADAAAFSAWQWRRGDTVVSSFLLNPPAAAAGPYLMRTGMYTFPDLQNVPLMDAGGNLLGDAVDLPLVTDR